MMFENNNKEVVKRITKRSLKTNKTRNIFAIVAIILTTFMISTVFSIGISFAKNYRVLNLRMQGTTATTTLKEATNEQYEKLKKLDIFKSVGYQINVGRVKADSLEKNKTKINMEYHDKVDWENQITPCISDIEGDYPIKENQVMASRKALEFLNLKDAKIGDKIKISYETKGGTKELEFLLSGYYTNYDIVQDTGYLMVSEEFIKSNNLTLEKDGTALMTLNSSEEDNAPDILESEIQCKTGQEFQYSYDITEESSSAAIATVITIIIALFIVLSGYLLIYNVMYISVIKDINFYGLMKTIGTSPRQIKKIVKGQILRLSRIGIPVGLILGVIFSFFIVPIAMGALKNGRYNGSVMPDNISFNPLIFLGAALFALLTVILSCNKPARVASSISPTEALSYSGIKVKKQKKSRKSTNGGKLYKMAWYNVFRDKKRAIIVFLSLFMGIITFLSINTFLDSLGVDNFINRYKKNDFEVQNINTDKEKLDKPLVDNIKSLQGIKNVAVTKVSIGELDMTNNFFLPLIEEEYIKRGISQEKLNGFLDLIKEDPSMYSSWILEIDDEIIERYNEEVEEKIDIEEFKKGSLALIEPRFYEGKDKSLYSELKGKNFNLKNKDTGVTASYKAQIISDANGDLPHSLGGVVGVPTIYISNSAMEKLDKDAVYYLLQINVEDAYESKIKQELKTLTNNRGLWFESKSDIREEFSSTSMVMKILGGGISGILILIGILNFINVMITGVNVRLKELAVMESIGMTKKQIKKMLAFEGAYYASITTLFIFTLGMGIIYGIAELTKKIADYAEFVFPTVPLLILIVFIFLVCLITPGVVFETSSKKSVIERIRETEN
ncbi:FtsX-like permease family protein [Clostridium sp.]|uniref:ABC transporter permease n=1 Tax=Clostridium sp. TaxID=1506 RepID=UPI00321627F7